jgi:hypothetical protein
MDDYFMKPVIIDGKIIEFEARLLQQGYIHRVEVILENISVLFEPDEERNYRALITIEHLEGKGKHLKRNQLEAIAKVLQSMPEA